MKPILFVFIFFYANTIFAQKIVFTEDFIALTQQAGVEILKPLETDYKSHKATTNPYQDYQAVLYSKKEKLEIRYAIEVYNEKKPTSTMPHLQVGRTVASTATNDEEAIIAFHDMSSQDLELFGADWGQVVIFRPKIDFSASSFCKMVTIYKEEKGTVFLFFLFNDANNSALDRRYIAAKFE